MLGGSRQTRDVDPFLVQCWPIIEATQGESLVYTTGAVVTHRPLGYERVYLPLYIYILIFCQH